MSEDDLAGASSLADMEDTLGGRLAHARDSAGLTLEKVAREMNLHPATINYWEADRAAPSSDSLEKLAAILGVSALWLKTGFGNGPEDAITSDDLPSPAVSRAITRRNFRRGRFSGV